MIKIGDRIDERYHITGKIAHGGMADVAGTLSPPGTLQRLSSAPKLSGWNTATAGVLRHTCLQQPPE